jgi:hypothetical protein
MILYTIASFDKINKQCKIINGKFLPLFFKPQPNIDRMKSYRLVLGTDTFETLPANIQTNRAAIEFVAKKFGIELPTKKKINWHKLKKDLGRHGVKAITSNDVAFFSRGMVLSITAPKKHEIDARGHKKKDVTVRAPRAKQRNFVNSPTFVGAGLALATAAG